MLIPTHSHSGEKNQKLGRAELVFTSFHGQQRANPEGNSESPMAVVVGSSGSKPFLPQHTQSTLTAVLWSENAQERNVKEVSSVISFHRGEPKRTDHCIWILRRKPEWKCLLLVSAPLTLAFCCVEMSGKVCREYSGFLPLNNELVILRFLWCVDPFSNPFFKCPLGMFIFNIYLILVLCGYFLPVSGCHFLYP